jgi:hypothetical protein
MYLSGLKVPYFLYSSSVSIKVISMGTTNSRHDRQQTSERMAGGCDGGTTSGDATSSWHDKMTSWGLSERMTRGRRDKR